MNRLLIENEQYLCIENFKAVRFRNSQTKKNDRRTVNCVYLNIEFKNPLFHQLAESWKSAYLPVVNSQRIC